MYVPSGAITGEESGHTPENDASTGFDQLLRILCDSRMTVQCAALRVKKSVFPSGEKVGEPSPPAPEMIPGAKISGVGGGIADADTEACDTKAVRRSGNRRAIRRSILFSSLRVGVSVDDKKVEAVRVVDRKQ